MLTRNLVACAYHLFPWAASGLTDPGPSRFGPWSSIWPFYSMCISCCATMISWYMFKARFNVEFGKSTGMLTRSAAVGLDALPMHHLLFSVIMRQSEIAASHRCHMTDAPESRLVGTEEGETLKSPHTRWFFHMSQYIRNVNAGETTLI